MTVLELANFSKKYFLKNKEMEILTFPELLIEKIPIIDVS